MPPSAHSSTKIIGVLAPSRERFQSIANLLKEPCIWLSEPLADAPAAGVDTVIVDSRLLAKSAVSIIQWHGQCRVSASPGRADRHESVASPTSLLRGEGVAHLQESPCQQSTSPLRPGRIVIYQCADHLDDDKSLENT